MSNPFRQSVRVGGHWGKFLVGEKKGFEEHLVFVGSHPGVSWTPVGHDRVLAYVTVKNQGPRSILVYWDGPPPAYQVPNPTVSPTPVLATDQYTPVLPGNTVTLAVSRAVKIIYAPAADHGLAGDSARGHYLISWCCPEWAPKQPPAGPSQGPKAAKPKTPSHEPIQPPTSGKPAQSRGIQQVASTAATLPRLKSPESCAGGCHCGCEIAHSPQDVGSNNVHLSDGQFHYHETDLGILGRGFDWKFERTYTSCINYEGPLGYKWDFSDNRRLFVDPTGDILRMDGYGRSDVYKRVGDEFQPPRGFYTEIVQTADGGFAEYDRNRNQAIFSPPDEEGIARLLELADRNGNRLRYIYNELGQLAQVFDTLGKGVSYNYDTDGHLVQVRDFSGRTITFFYNSNGDLISSTSPSITGTPNGNDFPAGKTTRYRYIADHSDARLNHNLIEITAPNEVAVEGPPRIRVAYEMNSASPYVGRVTQFTLGGTNASGVPAGGTVAYEYASLEPNDAGASGSPMSQTTATDRNGNRTEYQFDLHGNPVRVRESSNRTIRGNDATVYETAFEYNQDDEVTRVIHPEGNSVEYSFDDRNPDRIQRGNLLAETLRPDGSRGGDQAYLRTTYTYEPVYNLVRTVTDARGNDQAVQPSNGTVVSAQHYTTACVFDYQEGNNLELLAHQIGLSTANLRQLLEWAEIPLGLGDVNADGITKQVAGNVVKITRPVATLPPDSQMAVIEGGTAQPCEELYCYNQFGQPVKRADPEGNVTYWTYYRFTESSESQGHLKEETRDAEGGSLRNSRANPKPAKVRRMFLYNRAGYVVREVDARGNATEYAVNQIGQVVQIVRSAGHAEIMPDVPEPMPLTDFRYLERTFYDYNNNIVRKEIEDRGNTSDVTFDASSGTAFGGVRNIYDILDNVVEVSEEVGRSENLVTRFRYDPNQNRILVIFPEGNAVSEVYDERDLLFQRTRGAASPPSLALLSAADPRAYNARGGRASITSYDFDGNRNLVQMSAASAAASPAFGRTRMIYDGFDRRSSVVDGVGNQTVYQFAPPGHVVRVSRFGSVSGPSPVLDGPDVLGRPVSFGGVIQSRNLANQSLLEATENLYDERSRMVQSDRLLFVNSIPVVRGPDVASDAMGIGTSAIPRDGTLGIAGVEGVTILGRVSTRFEYDRKDRRTFTVDDSRNVFRTSYDGVDRVIEKVDPERNRLEAAYDGNGNVIEMQETDICQVSGVPPETFVSTNFYDSLNRLQKRVDNLGQTFEYRYDSRSNVVAVADALGPVGPPISRRVFAGGKNTLNASNGFGNVTRYFYDGINRRTREEVVLTGPGTGDGAHIGADLFGIKTSGPQPDAAQGGGDGLITTRYEWDRNSLLNSITDDNGNQTQFSHDNLDRRIFETKGNSVPPALADRHGPPTTITYEYDAENNVTRLTDENGSIITSVFDGANRITAIQIDRGPGVVGTSACAYEYDGLSRLTKATDNNEPAEPDSDSVVTFAYDSLSRIIEETQKIGALSPKVVSSAWRGADSRVGLTYPNGRTLKFRYDGLSRLKTVAEAGQAPSIAEYDYIGSSRVIERRCPANHTRMTYLDDAGGADVGYDGLRRPSQVRHVRDNNSLIVGMAHSYDRMNNKKAQECLHAPQDSELYGYDSASRLIKFRRGRLNAASDDIASPAANAPLHSNWSLDGVGNWTRVDNEGRLHSSFNELIERRETGVTNILYDRNGNQSSDGTVLATWDYRNRLRTVTRKSDNAVIAVYFYDALDRRIRKVVTNSNALNGTTDFYLDRGLEIEERDGADNLVQQVVHGAQIDEPLLLDRGVGGTGTGSDRLFYHQNALFSILAVTDASGRVIEAYNYDAYGRQSVISPASGQIRFDGTDTLTAGGQSVVKNPYLFTGRRLDPETGLYYYRQRYLHTGQGRFLSRWSDLDLDMNLYQYQFGMPTKLRDPMGDPGDDVELVAKIAKEFNLTPEGIDALHKSLEAFKEGAGSTVGEEVIRHEAESVSKLGGKFVEGAKKTLREWRRRGGRQRGSVDTKLLGKLVNLALLCGCELECAKAFNTCLTKAAADFDHDVNQCEKIRDTSLDLVRKGLLKAKTSQIFQEANQCIDDAESRFDISAAICSTKYTICGLGCLVPFSIFD